MRHPRGGERAALSGPPAFFSREGERLNPEPPETVGPAQVGGDPRGDLDRILGVPEIPREAPQSAQGDVRAVLLAEGGGEVLDQRTDLRTSASIARAAAPGPAWRARPRAARRSAVKRARTPSSRSKASCQAPSRTQMRPSSQWARNCSSAVDGNERAARPPGASSAPGPGGRDRPARAPGRAASGRTAMGPAPRGHLQAGLPERRERPPGVPLLRVEQPGERQAGPLLAERAVLLEDPRRVTQRGAAASSIRPCSQRSTASARQ